MTLYTLSICRRGLLLHVTIYILFIYISIYLSISGEGPRDEAGPLAAVGVGCHPPGHRRDRQNIPSQNKVTPFYNSLQFSSVHCTQR